MAFDAFALMLAMLALGRTADVTVPSSVFPVVAWVPMVAAAVRASVAGDHEVAVAEARRAVDNPGTPWRDLLPLRWMLGEVLARAGRDEEATTVLRAVEAEARAEGGSDTGAEARAGSRRTDSGEPGSREAGSDEPGAADRRTDSDQTGRDT